MDTFWNTNAKKFEVTTQCVHIKPPVPLEHGHCLGSVDKPNWSRLDRVVCGLLMARWPSFELSCDFVMLLVVKNSDYSIVTSFQELTEHQHAGTPNSPKFKNSFAGVYEDSELSTRIHISACLQLCHQVPAGTKRPQDLGMLDMKCLSTLRRSSVLSDGIAAYCSMWQHIASWSVKIVKIE